MGSLNKVLNFPIEILIHARPWDTCLIFIVYKLFLPWCHFTLVQSVFCLSSSCHLPILLVFCINSMLCIFIVINCVIHLNNFVPT